MSAYGPTQRRSDTVLQAASERVVYDKMDPKKSLDQAVEEFNQAIKK